MTISEFGEWFAYHLARFPAVSEWLQKMPEDAKIGKPSQQQVVDSWSHEFRFLPLADAKAASDLLFRGEEPEPKGFGRHPTEVLRICKELAKRRRRSDKEGPRIVDGQYVYECPLCEDSGPVSVYHARTIVQVAAGTLEYYQPGRRTTPGGTTEPDPVRNPKIGTAMVHCSCERGRRTGRELPVYHPDRFCLLTRVLPEDRLAEIQDWLERRAAAGVR